MDTNLEVASAKQVRSVLEALLAQAGATRLDRRYIKCPFHDDRTASAEIKHAAGGWYFKCHTCGIALDCWALQARLEGREVGEVMAETLSDRLICHSDRFQPPLKSTVSISEPPKPGFATLEELIDACNFRTRLEAKHVYTDPDTLAATFAALRLKKGESKSFIQASAGEDGLWRSEAPKGKLPLYNRGRIRTRDTVLVVEGEKCVEAFTALGMGSIAATTSPGGASAAQKADWQPLAGKKVILWPDNDEPGGKYIAEVLEILKTLDPPCTSISRVDPGGLELKPKGDIADLLAEYAGATNIEKAQMLEAVFADAEPLTGTSAIEAKFAAIAAGTFKVVPFLHKKILTSVTQALMPGTVTLLTGEEGSAKSFFLTEDFWRWTEAGEAVRILMMEEDLAFHQTRALAQMSGQADLLDVSFVHDNAEWAMEQLAAHRDRLGAFSSNVETLEAGTMSLDEAAAWVERWAPKRRVLAIDPITAATSKGESWRADHAFMMRIKKAVKDAGCSLMLTSHPRGGKNGTPGLSGTAGGKAYTRFSQTTLWLRALDHPADAYVFDGYTRRKVEYRHLVEVHKARSGRGRSQKIAMNLNYDNLCFDELGVLEEIKK